MDIAKTHTLVKFKRLSEDACVPTQAYVASAGFDLFSAENINIGPQDRVKIKTDLSIDLPSGTYGHIAPRSGLASNFFIGIGGGVVDPEYRGNIQIIVFNHEKKPFQVNKGMKIAQLIIQKIVCDAKFIEVPSLDDTSRGENGLGSSEN